jgi:acetoacetate decarboxylase
MKVKGIPFDSPLYEADDEHGGEYHDCEAIQAIFAIAGDMRPLLPEGLVPATDPPIGIVRVLRYGFSTVGPYLEQFSSIQVRDPAGEVGFYVPYIYVTSDAALAAGRELLGAPKKLARIELTREYDLVQGILERPSGKRLLTLTVKPDGRMDPAMRETLVASRNTYYSVRHLPPIGGKGGVTQLVKWYAEPALHRDARGEEVLFVGPTSLTYDSPSVIDPVHNLAVGELLAGGFVEFDMKLGVTQILWET